LPATETGSAGKLFSIVLQVIKWRLFFCHSKVANTEHTVLSNFVQLALLSAVAFGTAGIPKLEYLVFVEQVFINPVPLCIHLTGYDQL